MASAEQLLSQADSSKWLDTVQSGKSATQKTTQSTFKKPTQNNARKKDIMQKPKPERFEGCETKGASQINLYTCIQFNGVSLAGIDRDEKRKINDADVQKLLVCAFASSSVESYGNGAGNG